MGTVRERPVAKEDVDRHPARDRERESMGTGSPLVVREVDRIPARDREGELGTDNPPIVNEDIDSDPARDNEGERMGTGNPPVAKEGAEGFGIGGEREYGEARRI